MIRNPASVAGMAAFLVLALCLIWAGTGGGARAGEAGAQGPEPMMGEDGIYHQPWFLESFLELGEDLVEAEAEGKRLVVLWEQRGCPYCAEMHKVNLRIPEVVDYIKANFQVVQLNLWGDREVTDLDGEVLSEKALARKWGVQFTPTLQFLPDMAGAGEGKSVRETEAWRLMGYWKPFHFLNSFVYVKTRAYESQPNFQRWLQARAEELKKQGKEVKIW